MVPGFVPAKSSYLNQSTDMRHFTENPIVVSLLLVLALASHAIADETMLRKVADASAVAQRGDRTTGDGKRIALVIGNANYRHLNQLANPRNDAKDMCAALRMLSFEVICVQDVTTRRDLREMVRRFITGLSPNTVSFFYYAGHGVQVNEQNYLLPIEADITSEADVDYEGVNLAYLLQGLAVARSAPNIVVLDACRDNPFPNARQTFMTKGLARVDPPVGTILVYATGPNHSAMDGEGRNGLFTKHLLQYLSKPGVKIDEMLQLVAKGVEEEAKKNYKFEQTPYRSSSFSGGICLAGCGDPETDSRLEEIRKQRDTLNAKLSSLAEENVRLRSQAQEGSAAISKLEQRVRQLTEETSKHGEAAGVAQSRLEQARNELARARALQEERERVERENSTRVSELKQLRAELQAKEVEIDQYRHRIDLLEQERTKRTEILRDAAPAKDVNPKRKEVLIPSF